MSALEEDAEPKASSEVCEDTTTDAPEVEEIKEKVGEASNDEVSCTPDGKAETNESVENATPVEVVGIAGPQQTEKEGEGGRDQSILNLKELPRTGKRGAPQAFPHLLFLMLEREPKEVIQWTEEGRAFVSFVLQLF